MENVIKFDSMVAHKPHKKVKVEQSIGYFECRIRMSLSPKDIFLLAVYVRDGEGGSQEYRDALLNRLVDMWVRRGLSRYYAPSTAIEAVLKQRNLG